MSTRDLEVGQAFLLLMWMVSYSKPLVCELYWKPYSTRTGDGMKGVDRAPHPVLCSLKRIKSKGTDSDLPLWHICSQAQALLPGTTLHAVGALGLSETGQAQGHQGPRVWVRTLGQAEQVAELGFPYAHTGDNKSYCLGSLLSSIKIIFVMW